MVAETDRAVASKWPDAFLAINFHRTTHGEELTVEGSPYLAELYKLGDVAELVLRKCVQVGISEWLTIRMFRRAMDQSHNWAMLYVMPTEKLMYDFVGDRITRLLKQVPLYHYLQELTPGGSDRMGQKHIGTATIQFANAQTVNTFLSFAADWVIIDELDRCDSTNVAYAKDRLGASKLKHYWEVGNPTIQGRGIDKSFAASSQGIWHIKCPACNEWQPLDYFANVVHQVDEGRWELLDSEWNHNSERDALPQCRECSAPIDRHAFGEYVHEHPDRDIRGFHVSQLMSPNRSLAEIWADWRKAQGDQTLMQVFYNSVLGLPYTASGAKVTAELLQRCAGDYGVMQEGTGCTMGADVGKPNWATISDHRDGKRRMIQACPATWDELDNLMLRYDIGMAVIDAQPELEMALRFQARHPGKVFLCRYSTGVRMEFWKINDAEGTVDVGRTPALDRAHRERLERNVLYPRDVMSLDGGRFAQHMQAPTRVLNENARPQPRYEWQEGSQADHYHHANVYNMLAYMIQCEYNTAHVILI